MKNLNENALMQEMNLSEMQDVNGGIFPIVIYGVVITGKMAATALCAAAFGAGVYVGLQ